MIGTSSLLSRIHSLSHSKTVTIADGHSCSITGKEISQPTSSIPLSNVLYFPNLDVNLVSISALTKALYCSVKFFHYHCEFQDLQTRAQIGLGRETCRGLYELVPDSPSVGLSCLLSVKTSSILWHRPLGHPNLSKLKEASPAPIHSSPLSADLVPLDDLHLPIALRKGTRSCTIHPISKFVSYDRLSPPYHAFALSLAT